MIFLLSCVVHVYLYVMLYFRGPVFVTFMSLDCVNIFLLSVSFMTSSTGLYRACIVFIPTDEDLRIETCLTVLDIFVEYTMATESS